MRKARYLFIAALCAAMTVSSCKCSQSSPPVEEKPKAEIESKPPAAPVAKATPTPMNEARSGAVEEPAAEKPPLPEDFPSEIPVFEGANVEKVQPLANDAKNVIFVSDKGVPEIADFYRKQLEGGGWKMTQNSQRANHAFIAFKKGNMIANIQVVEDSRYPGKRLIAIMYENEKEVPFEF